MSTKQHRVPIKPCIKVEGQLIFIHPEWYQAEEYYIGDDSTGADPTGDHINVADASGDVGPGACVQSSKVSTSSKK